MRSACTSRGTAAVGVERDSAMKVAEADRMVARMKSDWNHCGPDRFTVATKPTKPKTSLYECRLLATLRL
jgi:hypothetical protein